MDLPEREPGKELAQTKPLSGPASAIAAIHRRCDQVINHQELAPSRVAQHSVSHGHDLEIPTVFWGRDSRLGHELRLDRLDPDGCSVRTRSVTNLQEPGHATARTAAGTASPATEKGGHLLICKVRRLDRGLLMGAPFLLCMIPTASAVQ